MIVDLYAHIVPYDPESPKGREVAARMTRILDDLEIELATQAALKVAAIATPAPIRRAAAA